MINRAVLPHTHLSRSGAGDCVMIKVPLFAACVAQSLQRPRSAPTTLGPALLHTTVTLIITSMNMISARVLSRLFSAGYGKVYALGGMGADTTPQASVRLYEPTKDQWLPLTSMPTPRYGAFSFLRSNKIYVLDRALQLVIMTVPPPYGADPRRSNKTQYKTKTQEGGGLEEDQGEGWWARTRVPN
ncbi:Kelch domain-containing protein 8B [Anabarilius grahami]|uniref:Kelch domain-containing protein 8B n=1 Tax=Anabarilius grahami TaxID=495550 RepID=A0A3N0Z465_ANAGA|nr:Kelch domain-containing protein 8B [Anabarilius grahami]